jgi:N-acetylglutamate synthase-like GNAT family acetyltransferase
MIIRKADSTDYEPLIELIKRTGEDEESAKKRASRVKSKNKDIFVIGNDYGLIGYAGLAREDNDERASKFVSLGSYACLLWIGVVPEYRRRGYGSLFLDYCDSKAKEYGKSGIWLDCGKKYLDFYRANGFKIRAQYMDEERNRYVVVKKFK